MKKPQLAADYEPGLGDAARRMCLHVAAILGDLMDEIVVVGGLVPYLVIDQTAADELHVGTRDVDLGLSLAIFDDTRYQDISDRLRSNGFSRDRLSHSTHQGCLAGRPTPEPGRRLRSHHHARSAGCLHGSHLRSDR